MVERKIVAIKMSMRKSFSFSHYKQFKINKLYIFLFLVFCLYLFVCCNLSHDLLSRVTMLLGLRIE